MAAPDPESTGERVTTIACARRYAIKKPSATSNNQDKGQRPQRPSGKTKSPANSANGDGREANQERNVDAAGNRNKRYKKQS